jgi:hypothetical protein
MVNQFFYGAFLPSSTTPLIRPLNNPTVQVSDTSGDAMKNRLLVTKNIVFVPAFKTYFLGY